ncbi:MAG: MauE/DoxX family redox-associated membrane protein [Solirubrobacteraceae bacterium]
MTTVVLVVRLVLVGVFALAGVSKLANLAASRDAVEGFGVPPRLARTVGTAIPFVELAVAVALLPTPSARWGAIGAAVLLAAFSAGIAGALRQGLAPDCNCFGQVASAPVSAKTLLRNGILAALALFAAIAGPGAALSTWTTNRSAADILAALATVTAATLTTVVYARRGGTVHSAQGARSASLAEALSEGTSAPEFELPGLRGERVSLREFLARSRPIVMIFASPLCPPCKSLLPHLARWNKAIGDDVTLVVVESGWHEHDLPDEQRTALGELITLTEPDRRLAEAYGAAATPCAVPVTPDGLISSAPMPGSSQVERLIRRVLETAAAEPRAGQAATIVAPA